MLTEAQKELARELGLTQQEARFSLATRIPLRRYAEIKAQIAAEREAAYTHEGQFGEEMVRRAGQFQAGGPVGRGQRPPGFEAENDNEKGAP